MKYYRTLIFILIAVSIFAVRVAAQQPNNRIYWMSTAQIPYGKIQEFQSFFKKEMLPLYTKAGYNFVSQWRTMIGNTDEVIIVAEFDDLASYQNARSTLQNMDRWKEILITLNQYIKTVNTKILTDVGR